jgi:hypothetical protein
VRSTFYKLAMISGQGGLVYLAGQLMQSSGDPAHAWSVVFFLLSVLFLLLCAYHQFILPRPADRKVAAGSALCAALPPPSAAFSRNPTSRLIARFPAAVPPRRGAAAETGGALPARPARTRAAWA